MKSIYRAAAGAASVLVLSSLFATSCYEPCDYPGESANCNGGTTTTTTTTTHGGGDCEHCLSMSTTCQPYTCVEGEGECKAGDPAATTVSCGDGGVCDGHGACVSCNIDTDCQATAASTEMRCYEHACFSCGDGIKNGNESGVDCGGACLACLGGTCAADTDCKSGTCSKGACLLPVASPCTDHAACATGLCDPVTSKCASCTGPAQCPSTQCIAGVCKAASGAPCGADTDCANASCDAESGLCLKSNQEACSTGYDCVSGMCATTCSACTADADCLGTVCIIPSGATSGACALGQNAYCAPGITPCATGLTCTGFPAKCQ